MTGPLTLHQQQVDQSAANMQAEPEATKSEVQQKSSKAYEPPVLNSRAGESESHHVRCERVSRDGQEND